MSRSRNRGKGLRIRAAIPPPPGRIRARPPPEASLGEGWEEITHLEGFQPGSSPKKLKLCVDCDVPMELVEALRNDNIPAELAVEAGINVRDDHAVAAWAKRRKRVLLTFNHKDFWNDTKHPLQKCPGIINMAIPKRHLPDSATALAILYESFARHFTLDWWDETKVRVTRKQYSIKFLHKGRVEQVKVKYISPRFYYKEC